MAKAEFLSDSPRMADIRAKYKAHVTAVLKLAKIADADAKAARIFDLGILIMQGVIDENGTIAGLGPIVGNVVTRGRCGLGAMARTTPDWSVAGEGIAQRVA
jgi:hypothetical protein